MLNGKTCGKIGESESELTLGCARIRTDSLENCKWTGRNVRLFWNNQCPMEKCSSVAFTAFSVVVHVRDDILHNTTHSLAVCVHTDDLLPFSRLFGSPMPLVRMARHKYTVREHATCTLPNLSHWVCVCVCARCVSVCQRDVFLYYCACVCVCRTIGMERTIVKTLKYIYDPQVIDTKPNHCCANL